MRFRIANMNCGGCAKGVTATLLKADPAARITFELDRKEASVASQALDVEAAERALRSEGWEAERLPS